MATAGAETTQEARRSLAAAGGDGDGSGGASSSSSRLPRVHSCSASCMGRTIHFHVTLLEGSCFLWVGGAGLGLNDLQVAVPTKYDPIPSVASIIGDSDGPGGNLAQKLSRKFGMLVFMSYNIPESEPEMMLAVQKESSNLLTELLAV
ncbi:unnamed protein product [Polarella glacialis]|uniref:Proteasome assembly chaperone 4 n=1 Tax=Polarella glacialis TaxID=89957 RepID=A0A813EZG8_POLGL|nr:unnamed protein product [Polarella glacialis]CAE8645811.1 unnamed protein product [Polarella glacialis]